MALDRSLIAQLERWGPEAPQNAQPMPEEEAWTHVRELALGHYENFSVLSRLVPARLRTDFAAVYAFCRWSDDLGDELGGSPEDRARATELLAWWRGELEACERFARSGDDSAPSPRHPVMIVLAGTLRRHPLIDVSLFHQLIDAFQQDQVVTEYETWDQLLGYCRNSADPVGRIVLALAGVPDDAEHAEFFRMSDATCTALQLINFWQDVRRDLEDRGRVYLPREEVGFGKAELIEWKDEPRNHAHRLGYIRAVRPLVDRTREMFEAGRPLPGLLAGSDRADMARVVWLFGAGGRSVLRAVEQHGCATLWVRPKLGKLSKLWLISRASVKKW